MKYYNSVWFEEQTLSGKSLICFIDRESTTRFSNLKETFGKTKETFGKFLTVH